MFLETNLFNLIRCVLYVTFAVNVFIAWILANLSEHNLFLHLPNVLLHSFKSQFLNNYLIDSQVLLCAGLIFYSVSTSPL